MTQPPASDAGTALLTAPLAATRTRLHKMCMTDDKLFPALAVGDDVVPQFMLFCGLVPHLIAALQQVG